MYRYIKLKKLTRKDILLTQIRVRIDEPPFNGQRQMSLGLNKCATETDAIQAQIQPLKTVGNAPYSITFNRGIYAYK